MKDTRKENYKEKVEHLKNLSGLNETECEAFIKFVYTYLNSCGYFESDFNIHGFNCPADWITYLERDFGHWLLDMALQYNMEQGKEYEAILIEDRYKGENSNYEKIKETLRELNNLE